MSGDGCSWDCEIELGFACEGQEDGAAVGSTCQPLPAFGVPERVTELSDLRSTDGDPSLTGDGLEVFFSSDRSGDFEIWTAVRAVIEAPFDAPTQVHELVHSGLDSAPHVSEDGLRLWFNSERRAPGQSDIWHTRRASRDEPWGSPREVAELSTPYNEGCPAVDPTETMIAFCTTRPGGVGDYDIWIATRASPEDPWGPPEPAVELNSGWADIDPFFVRSANNLYLGRALQGGLAALDLFTTSRALQTQPFARPARLEVSSMAHGDTAPWVSSDERTLYFSSSRDGAWDLYVARRAP